MTTRACVSFGTMPQRRSAQLAQIPLKSHRLRRTRAGREVRLHLKNAMGGLVDHILHAAGSASRPTHQNKKLLEWCINETGGGWLDSIMEKPEKHGLVHNGKARKTRPCYSWGILETTRGCSHSGPPACWRAFQKYCFSSSDFAFCHALFSL